MKTIDEKLEILYKEIFEELSKELFFLDGEIEEFNPKEKIITVVVDPKLQKYISILLSELTAKYDKKKKSILKEDPFYRIKNILKY